MSLIRLSVKECIEQMNHQTFYLPFDDIQENYKIYQHVLSQYEDEFTEAHKTFVDMYFLNIQSNLTFLS